MTRAYDYTVEFTVVQQIMWKIMHYLEGILEDVSILKEHLFMDERCLSPCEKENLLFTSWYVQSYCLL